MHAYFPKDYASFHAEYFELSRSYYMQYAHATPCPVTSRQYVLIGYVHCIYVI